MIDNNEILERLNILETNVNIINRKLEQSNNKKNKLIIILVVILILLFNYYESKNIYSYKIYIIYDIVHGCIDFIKYSTLTTLIAFIMLFYII